MRIRARTATQNHPLLAFFLLTFLFSWFFWLVSRFLSSADLFLARHLVASGAFGPSLAALALTLLGESENEAPLRWDPVLFTWLGTGLLYLVCQPYASTLPSQTGTLGWLARALLWSGPALLIGLALSARPALRRLVLPVPSQKTSPAWVAAALLFYPLVLAAGYAIDRALGGPAQVALTKTALEVALTILASLIYLTLFGGPLGEEAGWRGYALPRLQARFSPLFASLILASVWVVWRLPLMLTGAQAGDLLGLALTPFLTTFLYTWIYNHTRGNLLVCLVFHAAATTAALFLPTTAAAIGILTASSLAVILIDHMWLKI
jgi:uncharacterized protein